MGIAGGAQKAQPMKRSTIVFLICCVISMTYFALGDRQIAATFLAAALIIAGLES